MAYRRVIGLTHFWVILENPLFSAVWSGMHFVSTRSDGVFSGRNKLIAVVDF